MAILAQFQRPITVYLDTNCFIYFLENHPEFQMPVAKIFRHIIDFDGKIITSELTLAELLVKPYRLELYQTIDSYENFLNNSKDIELISINQTVLKTASQIKAHYKTPLADAIHIATAKLYDDCDIFVTNDEKMRGLEGLNCNVIFLKDLIPS